jgi:rare lipoprotein A
MKLFLIVLLALGVAGCPASRTSRTTTVEKRDDKKQQKKKKTRPKKPKKKVAKIPSPPPGEALEVQHGRAVWYGGDHHGGPTASGERFNKRAMTAAHRTLPMGTMVRVTNKKNGKSVVVRINDRGPFGKKKERIIDVSEAAAKKLGFKDAGVTDVMLEVLEKPAKKEKRKR